MLTTGLHYETKALDYLKRRKLRLVERNYHSRLGEIDLIMTHEETLVFVEVKYRKSNSHGSASESVTTSKQRKIIKTAQYYIQQHNFWHLNARFDVLAISRTTNPFKPLLFEWIQSAFDLE